MVKSLSLRFGSLKISFLFIYAALYLEICILNGVGKWTGWFDSSETEQLLYHSLLPQCQTPYPGKPNAPELHAVRVTTPLMKWIQKCSSGFYTLVDIHSASANWRFSCPKGALFTRAKECRAGGGVWQNINPARLVHTEQGKLKEVMLEFDSKWSRSACGDQKCLSIVVNVHYISLHRVNCLGMVQVMWVDLDGTVWCQRNSNVQDYCRYLIKSISGKSLN